nr:PREDICTED: claudin-3-like [Latimeria chalumnae]|eukprot:XP_005992295.1 PREDICTED: claudin-3-like [Latimeria chalumnae]
MVSKGLQITGIVISFIGWSCSILACALPMWKVTAFIGTNIVVAEIFWEGLWMTCVHQSTGQLQCKIYDNLLELTQELQAARALISASIAVALLGLMIAIVGAKCTRFVEDEPAKAKISLFAGITFIIAAVLTLVPVSWSANNIIRDFYNPVVPEVLKRELGASLYIGWASSGLLIIGGAFLCCSCISSKNQYPVKYAMAKPTSQTSYAIQNYV